MPLRLARLSLREIRLPLVEPFRSAGGTVDARRVLLAQLHDADGHTAWSECVAQERPTYSADTIDTCWLALTEWLAPALLGVDVGGARDVHARLAAHVRGHAMARATLEMGMWTLDATRRAQPLAVALADAAGAAPRTHVATGLALGMHDTPDALAAHARDAMAQGYRRLRMKVSPGHDVEWVRAVRAALDRDAVLAVDANGSYSLDDPAHLDALRALDTLGLAMIEQPLAHDDLVRHAELQRRLDTPLCLDESITGLAATQAMLALGAARIVNLKPGRVGGFTEALAIHDECSAEGIALWCGGMLETGIGRAHNVALASLPGFTEPGDLSPSARYWSRDIVRPAWTMDAAGLVRVPLETPGLGVEVDVDYIDELTTRVVSFEM